MGVFGNLENIIKSAGGTSRELFEDKEFQREYAKYQEKYGKKDKDKDKGKDRKRSGKRGRGLSLDDFGPDDFNFDDLDDYGSIFGDSKKKKESRWKFKRNGLIKGLVKGALNIKEKDWGDPDTAWDKFKEHGFILGSFIVTKDTAKKHIKKISANMKKLKAQAASAQAERAAAEAALKNQVKQNEKVVEEASKNDDFINDKAEAGATFLNEVNKTLSAAVANSGMSDKDYNGLKGQLQDINKSIQQYHKDSIDKQDTEIKKSSDQPQGTQKVSMIQKLKEQGNSNLPKGLLGGLLKWLLGLGIFGAIVAFWNWLNKFIGMDPRIWNKIGAFLGFIAKTDGYLRKIVTAPVKWFMDDILPKAKGKILEWVDIGVEKVKGWANEKIKKITDIVNEKFKWLSEVVDEKLKSISNIIKESALGKAVSGAIDTVIDTAKSVKSAVGGFFGDLWDKGVDLANKGKALVSDAATAAKTAATGWLGKAKDTVCRVGNKLRKLLGPEIELYNMFVESVKKSIPIIKRVGSKVFWLAKTVTKFGIDKTVGLVKGLGKKLLAKVVAKATWLLASAAALVTGPVGLIVQVAFIAWTAWDIYNYMANLHPEENFEYKIIPALVYALIGWDLLDKDTKDVWNNIPELDPSEKDKITNSLNSDQIKKASFEEAEQIKNQLAKESEGYNTQISRLSNNTIQYKDANGNLLSDDDSAKIQALQLEQYVLRDEKSKLLQEKINRKDPKKYFEGEAEISAEPAKFQKLADYWFDKIKLSNSTCRLYSGDFDFMGNGAPNLTNIEKDRQTHLVAMNRLLREGDIVGAAREKGWADYYEKGIQLAKSGKFKSWNSITKELEKHEAYETINEKLVKINQRINVTQRNISRYGTISEASSTSGAFSGAAEVKGSVSPSAGADLSGATTFSDVQSAIASGSGTSRAVAAANYAWNNVRTDGKTGACAKYVNDAIVNAGYKNYGRGHGYQVGQSLMNIGWRPLLSGESLKVGDVACIGKFPGHQYGHAAILSPDGWVSDFRQKSPHPAGIYSGSAFTNASAVTTIYRDPGNSSMNVRTSLSNKVLRGPSISASGGADFGGGSSTQSQAPIVIANNVTNNPVVNNVTSSADLTDYWSLLP